MKTTASDKAIKTSIILVTVTISMVLLAHLCSSHENKKQSDFSPLFQIQLI